MAERSPWLPSRKTNSRAKVRLLCFPYAGGSEVAYRTWQQNMPDSMEVLPIQLPGRGVRTSEPLFTRLAPMVLALTQSLVNEMDLPFALFGHSMGGLIAFEFARSLRRERQPLPVHLFISAKCCPQPAAEAPAAELSESQLIEALWRYEGTPAEVLDNPELMQVLMPVLQADMELCKTHVCEPEPPLECPITAFGGLEDPVSGRPCLEGWRQHTTGPFKLRMLPAGHFFLKTWEKAVLEIIFRELAVYV